MGPLPGRSPHRCWPHSSGSRTRHSWGSPGDQSHSPVILVPNSLSSLSPTAVMLIADIMNSKFPNPSTQHMPCGWSLTYFRLVCKLWLIVSVMRFIRSELWPFCRKCSGLISVSTNSTADLNIQHKFLHLLVVSHSPPQGMMGKHAYLQSHLLKCNCFTKSVECCFHLILVFSRISQWIY